jgi:hypothetical protein
VAGEYHASATCRSQCVAPRTTADSQVYEQGVGRDHFVGLSCTARRGRTTASTGRREPHRAGQCRSLIRRSRPASSHSRRAPSPRAGPEPAGAVQRGKRPHRATAPIAVKPNSGEAVSPPGLTRRASRVGAGFPRCVGALLNAGGSSPQRLCLTRPAIPSGVPFAGICAADPAAGCWSMSPRTSKSRHDAPSTRKPGRAVRCPEASGQSIH